MCKLAGPQHRSWRKVSIQKCASWRGPNIEAGAKSAYNNVQVGGAPTQKLTESQLTIMWKLGSDDEINFAKISFLSHLTQNKFHYP
ncbi:hypothetical protein B5M25_03935 [Staphylococcus aureus]|nr:hypothetical protein B5M25_03935 [Staphylococcus aureus]